MSDGSAFTFWHHEHVADFTTARNPARLIKEDKTAGLIMVKMAQQQLGGLWAQCGQNN
jgi:hypothetical protein